jgi:hypothetical protein
MSIQRIAEKVVHYSGKTPDVTRELFQQVKAAMRTRAPSSPCGRQLRVEYVSLSLLATIPVSKLLPLAWYTSKRGACGEQWFTELAAEYSVCIDVSQIP